METNPWEQHLAHLAAHAIARLVSSDGLPAEGGWPTRSVLTVAAQTVSERGLTLRGSRHTSARQHLACYIAVYARWFAPDSPAILTAHQHQDAVLRWQLRDGSERADILRCTKPGIGPDGPAPAELSGDPALEVRSVNLTAPLESHRWSQQRWTPLTPHTTQSAPLAPLSRGVEVPALLTRAAS